MANRRPKLLTIPHDTTYAKFVGKTTDSRQFFLTTPFIITWEGKQVGRRSSAVAKRRDFLALYLFDKQGQLVESRITDLGLRGRGTKRHAQAIKDRLLQDLEPFTFGPIRVRPFVVTQPSYRDHPFGLIEGAPEDECDQQEVGRDEWVVCASPTGYMEFRQPWNSGAYRSFIHPDNNEHLLCLLT